MICDMAFTITSYHIRDCGYYRICVYAVQLAIQVKMVGIPIQGLDDSASLQLNPYGQLSVMIEDASDSIRQL